MFIQIKNLRIHYRVMGEGPVLLFLHGWGASIVNYKALLEHLGQHFKVIALDLPGCGLSSMPEQVWASENYVALVSEFLQSLKLTESLTIVGHSLGGKIALLLSAQNNFTVQKLVLIASAGIRAQRGFKKRFKVASYKLLKKIALLPFLKVFFAKYISRYQAKVGSEDYRNAKGVMRATLVKLVNEDIRELLPQIEVPSLLIWGEQDQSTTLGCGELMANLLPQAKLVVIKEAGHFVYLDKFAECVAALDQFLLP